MTDSSEVSRRLDAMLRVSDVIHAFLEKIEIQKLAGEKAARASAKKSV